MFAFAKAELKAQAFQEIGDILTDLLVLSDKYVEPAAEASAFQSAAGWSPTATSLGLWEFDLGFHINTLYIPQSEQQFSIANSDFRNVRIRGSEQATLPSALGGEVPTEFEFTLLGDVYEFAAFEGVKYDFLPHPYVQGRLGLWYDTELIVRYSPEITIDKSGYGILGVGLKHDFTHYWVKNRDTAIHVAGLVSYSEFDLSLFFDPFAFTSTQSDFPLAVIDGTIINSRSWLYQLQLSKRWGNLEVQAAAAYTTTEVEYQLSGNESVFVDLLNDVLVILNERQYQGKIDVGVNYYFDQWYLTSSLSSGQFLNLNVGGYYRF